MRPDTASPETASRTDTHTDTHTLANTHSFLLASFSLPPRFLLASSSLRLLSSSTQGCFGTGCEVVLDQMEKAIATKSAPTNRPATAADVATSFRRLFRVRMQLGMLDPPLAPGVAPYNALRFNSTELGTNSEHIAVNKQASLQSMTLLKNSGKALPLDVSTFQGEANSLAVVGLQAGAETSGILLGDVR